MRFILLAILMVGLEASAATYYIDYASGSDAAAGTSTATAWKLCPGMNGFAGTYSHAAGDRFIFKGGVVWPASCFQMSISTSGASGTPDYYGVDASYYSGASWAKPIFDGGGASISQGNHNMLDIQNQSYVTLDSLIVTNFAWTGTVNYGSCCMVGCYNSYNLIIENCSFVGWSHSGTSDDSDVIFTGSGLLTNCVFDGSPNGTDSMMAMHGGFITRNCTIRNMANGLVGNFTLATGNNIGPINHSFAGVHENGIESVTAGSQTIVIASNIVHDCCAISIYIGGGSSMTSYVFNNLVYNIGSPSAITVDGDSTGTGTNYIWNNTLPYGNGTAVYVPNKGATVGKLVVQNNHFIGDSGSTIYALDTVTDHTYDHNLTNTTAEATVLGYVVGNLWQPTSGSSSTVGTGVNEYSEFTTDRLGVGRPQVAAWDIGAYEYGTNAPAGTNAVLQYHLDGITGGGFTL